LTAPNDILIAEDSPTQAVQLEHLLQTQGYRVEVATNGINALLAARKHKPTLVIADVDMPAMDGYEMCRGFKQDEHLRNVPVILLTSLTDPGDVLRGLEVGADYYVTKPYQPEYLLSRVREILINLPANAAPAPASPIEIVVNGRPLAITADRRQILTLLLSTYSDAVQRNTELIRSQRELTRLNQQLMDQTRELNRRNQLLDAAARSEQEAHEALKAAQSQLVQSEKMAGLGQMVAGIAHEINNPLSFVINNEAILQRDLTALNQLLELYGQAERGLSECPDLLNPIREMSQRIDLPYIMTNLPGIFARSREGLKRIQQTVTDLRDFVRLDQSELSEVDLNSGIDSTVNIIRHKAKLKQIEIEMDLQPLPKVFCYPAKINQVIMNLVANAIDASPSGETVVIRSRANGSGVQIEVIDHGHGIDPAIRSKIFDPFFTTKPPGEGTGLGLSISYGIIRDHGGRIEVDGASGKGAHFTVCLPLRPEEAEIPNSR